MSSLFNMDVSSARTLNKLWNKEVFHLLYDVTISSNITEHRLKSISNIEYYDSDSYLYSYIRSGTNWMKSIISLILNDGQIQDGEFIGTYFPLLESVTHSGLESFCLLPKHNRWGSVHYPLERLPKGKIVYIARNPKDVLVSTVKLNILNAFCGTFEDYFNMFVFHPEDLICGDHLNHVHHMWLKRNDPNIVFLFYEDLKFDPFNEIKRISEFLGYSHEDQKISEIVTKTDFKYQKARDENKRLSPQMTTFKDINFFRKGQVGDWVNHFTVAQNRIFDEVYRRRTEAMDDPVPFKFEIDLEK